jgi:hypothetical protein
MPSLRFGDVGNVTDCLDPCTHGLYKSHDALADGFFPLSTTAHPPSLLTLTNACLRRVDCVGKHHTERRLMNHIRWVFSEWIHYRWFGDWNGPNGTLIKRRYSGPLPEIKKELKRRTDSVAFRPIWSTRRRSLTARRGHVWRIWLRHRGVVTRKEDGSTEEVEDPQSDALPNQSTGRLRPPPPNVEPRRQCFENILMLLMMEIRGFERPSQFKRTHKCHRGVPVRRHQRSKWLKELRKRYPCAPLGEEIWSRDRNKIRTRCPIIFWLRPYAFRSLVIS